MPEVELEGLNAISFVQALQAKMRQHLSEVVSSRDIPGQSYVVLRAGLQPGLLLQHGRT